MSAHRQGSVLIFSLWVLALLTMFAVSIGLSVRQRATLFSRIENRSQLRWIAEAGIKKAIGALKEDWKRNNGRLTAEGKQYLYNNPDRFKSVGIGAGIFNVFNESKSHALEQQRFYGVVDEERKLNINTASLEELVNLFQRNTPLDVPSSQALAEAIADWRQAGESKFTGYYSDDFYLNLEYPFEPKDAQFEMIDELILIRGMTAALLEQLQPFITIYGQGQVNVNTAPREVFSALGLNDSVIEKILEVRRGPDGEENTFDDYIFYKTYDIVSEMLKFVKLEVDEIKEIDRLNSLAKFTTVSSVYSIQSQAILNEKKQDFVTEAVFDLTENRILYWREKF